jgi:hypothetical protein
MCPASRQPELIRPQQLTWSPRKLGLFIVGSRHLMLPRNPRSLAALGCYKSEVAERFQAFFRAFDFASSIRRSGFSVLLVAARKLVAS